MKALWNRIKRSLGLWSEGVDPTRTIQYQEDAIQKAERDMGVYNVDPVPAYVLRHVAGVEKAPRRKRKQSAYLSIFKYARSQTHRLAAARMLAERGEWNLKTMRLYAQTGYQEKLLPHNPLFAFMRLDSEGEPYLPDFGELSQWFQGKGHDTLAKAVQWHDQEVVEQEPELYELWAKTLVFALGPIGIQQILDWLNKRQENPMPLIHVVNRHLRSTAQLIVQDEKASDGTVAYSVEVPHLFSLPLLEKVTTTE